MAKARGSVWQNDSKKSGYGKSIGAYEFRKNGERFFVLTSVLSGVGKEYSSPRAAIADGWYIVEHGK